MNPYEVFGIGNDFTLEQLKERFKQLVLKVHPDRGGSEELFKMVSKAFKLLLRDYNNRVSDRQFHELKKEFQQMNLHLGGGDPVQRQGRTSQPQPRDEATMARYAKEHFNIDKFNRIYEENKSSTIYDTGYEKWMQQQVPEETKDMIRNKKGVSADKFNQLFEKNVKVNRDLVVYKEPEPLEMAKSIAFMELGKDKIDDFSGENKSERNLTYTDYRVAHSTHRLADPRMVKNMPKYRNVDELEAARSKVQYHMNENQLREYELKKKLQELKEKKRLETLRKQDDAAVQQYERLNMLLLGGVRF